MSNVIDIRNHLKRKIYPLVPINSVCAQERKILEDCRKYYDTIDYCLGMGGLSEEQRNFFVRIKTNVEGVIKELEGRWP